MRVDDEKNAFIIGDQSSFEKSFLIQSKSLICLRDERIKFEDVLYESNGSA